MIVASVSVIAETATPAYDTSVSVTALTDGDVAHFYQIVEWVGTANGNIRGWAVKDPFNFDLEKVLLGDKATQASQSLPQAAKLPVQGKVDFGKNACVFAERRMRSFS